MQNELQNEEDDDERSSVQSHSKYDETGIGSPSSGEEIREANPLKRKQLTVEKR